ncbi:isoamyl alcohol oxidase [Ilyonectria destructans]|nr:isoamyl alcohol oxidase [Ilyonectria destructans]
MVSFTLTFAAAALAAQSAVAISFRPGLPKSGLVPRTWNEQEYGCKCYPGDDCWPKQSAWDALNKEVNGNLHVHIPPEAACHNTFDSPLGPIKTYNEEKCAQVTANWTSSAWTINQQALLIWKYWTNVTCLPTDDPTSPCTLGFYGVYVIEAKTRHHIASGVKFARRNNLRLAIRNTGHDFAGRSTGWGTLVINTHSLKDITVHDKWKGPSSYKGGAITIGAGVQGYELMRSAQAHNPPLAVVAGECPTVGPAGGFIAGGGHSPLSSVYGLAADNTLQFEVITAKGEFVVANEKVNPDLYFALRGGGPSTFGVVVSVTFRTYDEVIASGGSLTINSSLAANEDVIWEGVRIFHKWSNHMVDNGLYVYFEILPFSFQVLPFVAIGKTKSELDEILKPLLHDLREARVPFDHMTKEYDGFFDLYQDLFEDDARAGLHALSGGWGFTHEDIENNNDGIIEAFRTVQSPRPDLQYAGVVIGHLFNPGHGRPTSTAALNPRWRNSTNFVISVLGVPQNASLEMKADLQHVQTYVVDAALREAGPKGYAYINEADPFLPNFPDHFWGPAVYPKLKVIRQKWDPDMVFFAMATVGTEKWEVIEENTRLCKRLD